MAEVSYSVPSFDWSGGRQGGKEEDSTQLVTSLLLVVVLLVGLAADGALVAPVPVEHFIAHGRHHLRDADSGTLSTCAAR